MRVVVTGATGFIGQHLVNQLRKEGISPVLLSRKVATAQKIFGPDIEAHAWNPEAEPAPASVLETADAVIHLAGEGIANRRWTEKQKAKILTSRILGTRNLVSAINGLKGKKPSTLISASAIGFYGNRGSEILNESSLLGNGFLSDVCSAWEAEARKVDSSVRLVTPRIGIVLGKEGGALTKLLPLFKLGGGGPVGSGKQYMSWIHVQDVVGLLIFALKNASVKGAMNTVAPHPVTNAAFSKALGKALHRPAFMPAPAFALKLAMGELSALVLHSQRVIPEVAEKAGYKFIYPEIQPALDQIAQKTPRSNVKMATATH
ncbi:TIGR01777 family protein [bacterium]|nr:TIGR01777 family protein [bacterium]NBX82653.1 TIGR01777 family protein [bacterium]